MSRGCLVVAGEPWPPFPGGNGEVTAPRLSFESTRRRGRPANSFMVSVTAPGGAPLGVLGPQRVNST
ncbi:hypothetical protein E2C00_23850 [Streptomyces sp. WAC05374]|nr:hypothetical protein EF905_33005 [Streptomyces sp. WAC05374]TDF42728.1 hypothetical protein E2B92_22215 [Streptomyces sp. WAC05374]TDF51287.1 hypothetical protein E2C02_24710 [Streptomyces sp. WAC05374]TDF52607.1 hypothetical protein E2C00_23850 [Streptomyces sp. WAC05374]